MHPLPLPHMYNALRGSELLDHCSATRRKGSRLNVSHPPVWRYHLHLMFQEMCSLCKVIIHFLIVTEVSATLTDVCAILENRLSPAYERNVPMWIKQSLDQSVNPQRHSASLELYPVEENLLSGKRPIWVEGKFSLSCFVGAGGDQQEVIECMHK